jgi:predicted DNA-binding protein (MmcQ/YjbR family)
LNIEEYRNYCLRKKGVTEEFPFDENVLVFKVMGKIFALTDVNEFETINLKCDPEEAVLLREKYDAVQPGYHMNKKHWNTILLDGSVPDKYIFQWIDHSYDRVVEGLTKKLKEELGKMK